MAIRPRAMLTPKPQMSRKQRYPTHSFHVEAIPFTIQPFMIAPVLPGETMQNALLQVRAVTDPIKNSIIGWHNEYYLFYVKHRDIDTSTDNKLQSMMLDPSTDLSSFDAVADNTTYHSGPGMNWAKLCLQSVTEEFFRDEGDAWNNHTIEGMPVAKINNTSILDSAILDTGMTSPDVDVDLDADGTVTASEVMEATNQWSLLRMQNLTDMTYEDYLRTYGLSIPKSVEDTRPELIRYVRDWQYPSNTIDPSNGSPTSAVSWSIAERADKARFFKEPGFIYGVTVTRPKVYLANQTGSASYFMNDAYSWLPGSIMHNKEATWKQQPYVDADGGGAGTDNEGPFPLTTHADGYWVDIADLLVHGDQFTNKATIDGNMNGVNLPTADFANKYYLSGNGADGRDQIQAMFSSASFYHVNMDGVCNLNISSRVEDKTPGETSVII